MNIDISKLVEACSSIVGEFRKLSESVGGAEELVKLIRDFPDHTGTYWARLAQKGWHIDWEMRMDVLRIGTEDPDKLDQFMIEHLQTSWDALTERILILHPERCKILTRAFQHIENEDWISAIPLLFSQTDGILMKTFGVSIFYKKNQLEKKIKKKVTNRDMLLNMILDVLMIDTPFDEAHQTSAETSECPNRHAIIHGNENHLEYGTRPNGYKAFSLLCFAVHCCYEVDNA